MRIKIAIFITIFFGFNNTVFSVDYYKYYLNTSKAELYILEFNYKEALSSYEKAFSEVDIPWAIDYHNACIASILCKEFDKTYTYLYSLLEKGLPKSYYIENYDSLIKDQKKWITLKSNLDSELKRINEKKRTDIKEELKSRIDLDQYYRKQMNVSEVEYIDSFKYVVVDNMSYYLELIDSFGVPDENLMNIKDPRDVSPVAGLLILHFLQQQMMCAKHKPDYIPSYMEDRPDVYSKAICYCNNNSIIDYPLISILRKAVLNGEMRICTLSSLYSYILSDIKSPKFFSKYSSEGTFLWTFSEEQDKLLMDLYNKILDKKRQVNEKIYEQFLLGWQTIDFPENFIKHPEWYKF